MLNLRTFENIRWVEEATKSVSEFSSPSNGEFPRRLLRKFRFCICLRCIKIKSKLRKTNSEMQKRFLARLPYLEVTFSSSTSSSSFLSRNLLFSACNWFIFSKNEIACSLLLSSSKTYKHFEQWNYTSRLIFLTVITESFENNYIYLRSFSRDDIFQTNNLNK